MSIVTNQIADSLAQKVTESMFKELEKMKKELKSELTKLVRAEVPKEIMEAYKKHPRWVHTVNDVFLNGRGWNHHYLSIEESPGSKSSGRNFIIEDTAENNQIRKMYDAIDDFKKTCDKTKSEYKNCFLALRTFKKVEAAFPELKPFLPQKEPNMMLIPALDKLQQQLPKLITA